MRLWRRTLLSIFIGALALCLCGAVGFAEDDSSGATSNSSPPDVNTSSAAPVTRQPPRTSSGATVVRQSPGEPRSGSKTKEKVFLPPRLAEVLRLVKSGIEDDIIAAYINQAPYDYRLTLQHIVTFAAL